MKNYFKIVGTYGLTIPIIIKLILIIINRGVDSLMITQYKALYSSLGSDGVHKEVIILIAFISASLILSTLNTRIFIDTEKYAKKYREDLYNKVTKLPLCKLQKLSFPSVIVTIDSASSVIEECFSLPGEIVSYTSIFLFGVIIMGMHDIRLTIIVCLLSSIVIIVFKCTITEVNKLLKLKRENATALYKCLSRLEGFMTIKSFGKEEYEKENYRKESSNLFLISRKKAISSIRCYRILDLMSYLIDIFVIYYCIYYFKDSKECMMNVMLFIGLTSQIYGPIISIPDVLENYSQFKIHLDENSKLMEETEELDGEINLSSFEDKILFNKVSFSYDESDTIINKLNLSIKKGEKLGIYGKSGNGKSTLVNLINRFFPVTEGTLSIDGIDINKISSKSLRKIIGNVSQEAFIFSDMSILDNIRYGTNISESEVIEAAKAANAHEFIKKLPDGYNSLIGNNGVMLSGGERQRIALARIFLLNPEIIILDESTSKLDNETEKLVVESINRLMEGKTVISIAHRLSTLKGCDRLICIDNHQIVEEGTYEELSSNKDSQLYSFLNQ